MEIIEAFLSIAYKILAITIMNRFSDKIMEIVGVNDGEMVDHIFVLMKLQAENQEYRKDTYVIFIDFKKADKIKRKKLYRVLTEPEIKKNHRYAAVDCKTVDAAKVWRKNSNNFQVKDRLKERDLSTILFHLVLEEKKLRNSNLNRSSLIYHKRHQLLMQMI